MALVEDIDAVLPQTQCGECGYPGCLPYAQALASGQATIDCCPPGGVETVKALGKLLGINPNTYLDAAAMSTRAPSVAKIREPECIGCTKCIQACPVDAIIGSAKHMHAVISHECTGCGLCVEPCPVDCIDLIPLSEPAYEKELARERYQARTTRLLREKHEQQQQYREKRLLAKKTSSQLEDVQAKQSYIQQALARVQAKNRHE